VHLAETRRRQEFALEFFNSYYCYCYYYYYW